MYQILAEYLLQNRRLHADSTILSCCFHPQWAVFDFAKTLDHVLVASQESTQEQVVLLGLGLVLLLAQESVLLGLEPVPESEQVKGMQRRLVQQAFLVEQQLRLQRMIEQQLGEVELWQEQEVEL